MGRKTTTKAFRERAVSMVLAGQTAESVAEELGVESQKVRRWFNNAINNSASVNPGIFDVSVSSTPITKPLGGNKTVVDREKRRLEQENKHLRELVHLSTQWISAYIAMQTEHRTGH
ncbi:hypothetical protein [Endozoicomonas sp. YOMI1]|uniref:hypothetical protein n=1 Tax=Endozoicomonas sp. YOMI1 TaxID=2828739 RepID=UPI002147E5EE|nr:hypothetical protein [Endozoicomonas sp. YOMI1]